VRKWQIDNSKLPLDENGTFESKVIDKLTTNQSDKFKKDETQRQTFETVF